MPWFGLDPAAVGAAPPTVPALLQLAERKVARFDPAGIDASPGRRLRAFATLVCLSDAGVVLAPGTYSERVVITEKRDLTYRELLQLVDADAAEPCSRALFSRLALRIGESKLIQGVPDASVKSARDPDLHPALQDLGDEINEDIREALDTLDSPTAWYPGIDEGIEPVTDDHVRTVIWALQRELDRELRVAPGSMPAARPLPAAPLADLSWNVQRALTERRRWRYKQWGIGRDQWLSGQWSLWDVPEEPDYVPRRSARLSPVTA